MKEAEAQTGGDPTDKKKGGGGKETHTLTCAQNISVRTDKK